MGDIFFGKDKVGKDKKDEKVQSLFTKVAPVYDRMNDIMSLGWHRIWKKEFVYLSSINSDHTVLEVAAGSGDVSLTLAQIIKEPGMLYITDPNPHLLQQAKNKLLDNAHTSPKLICANAYQLPFEDNSFDRLLISFGLRNIADMQKALLEFNRVLKPNGKLSILEFSRPNTAIARALIDAWSKHFILPVAEAYCKDKPSYEYLIDSIRQHPPQKKLCKMLLSSHFAVANYVNLSLGITAVHTAIK